MDIITLLSKGTLKLFKVDKIIKLYNQKDYTIIEDRIKNTRNKDIKITQEDIKQLAENGALIFWSGFLEYAIVLLIACYLNIFLTTFLIMNTFTILRLLAGGVHMSTFNKCFAVMIILFLTLGYLVNQVQINFLCLNVGFIWCIIMAINYAPQERADKSDKDCNNGNKMKHRSIIFIISSYIICLIFIHNQLISSSIFAGVMLEIFTITPIGTKLFQWIDIKKV